MIRVVAPSRLHFGLFRVPTATETADEAGARAFGGVGLMVDQPGVSWSTCTARGFVAVRGYTRQPARAGVRRSVHANAAARSCRRPFQMLVERCPAEHTGLGVGTQLGLAVAKALAVGCGHAHLPATDLATRVGRGARSAIGVHGFDRGGLLVDAGKLPGEAVAPLLAHVALPREWRVVLFAPPSAGCWHGEHERAAFATAVGGDTNTPRRLAEEVIVPAAERGDIDAFGEAAHEFNRRAGEPFAAVQGGPYASHPLAELIADVRACGVRGVGQSSWGPTVFAVAPDSDTALSLVLRFRSRVHAFVARTSAGHTVEIR